MGERDRKREKEEKKTSERERESERLLLPSLGREGAVDDAAAQRRLQLDVPLQLVDPPVRVCVMFMCVCARDREKERERGGEGLCVSS